MKSRGLSHHIPILGWLPRYNRSWFSADLIAGLSVWALLVPQGIAYASIAGVPAQFGLYTALGALIGYALFGTSKQLVTGPSATVAAVSFSVIGLLAAASGLNSAEWIGYTAALAVMVGIVYLALGLLKMGWISNFLSKAVLEGFIFAFGIGLMVDQSHKILGVPKVDGSYWNVLVGTLKEIPQTNPYTLLVGVSAIILLLLMRRFAPKLPRADRGHPWYSGCHTDTSECSIWRRGCGACSHRAAHHRVAEHACGQSVNPPAWCARGGVCRVLRNARGWP